MLKIDTGISVKNLCIFTFTSGISIVVEKIAVICKSSLSVNFYKACSSTLSAIAQSLHEQINRTVKIKIRFNHAVRIKTPTQQLFFSSNINRPADSPFITYIFRKTAAYNFNLFNIANIYSRKIKSPVLGIVHTNSVNNNTHRFISKSADTRLLLQPIRTIGKHLHTGTFNQVRQRFYVHFFQFIGSKSLSLLNHRRINISKKMWQDNFLSSEFKPRKCGKRKNKTPEKKIFFIHKTQ